MTAEANPRRAVDPQKPLTQRRRGEGSKIWSLTKAMRCGISSSRKEKRAAPVSCRRCREELERLQREEGRPGQLQTLQLFAAGETALDVGFHLDPLRRRQFLEEIVLQIEWGATHDKPP